MTSDKVAMRLIVDRQTPVKTLPSLAVGNYGTNSDDFIFLSALEKIGHLWFFLLSVHGRFSLLFVNDFGNVQKW